MKLCREAASFETHLQSLYVSIHPEKLDARSAAQQVSHKGPMNLLHRERHTVALLLKAY